jgi:hypothetical protein
MMPFLESWVKGGFFTLADETNSFVAERTCLLSGICAAGEEVTIQTRAGAGFPHDEYEEEGIWSLLGGFYVTLMSIAMLYPVSNLVGVLVLEKETRQREGMYMMSMQPLALFTSWHIYALMTSIPLALMLSLVGAINLYTHSDFFYIYWHFQIFFIACASFACVVSQLFSTVRSASMIGNALFFIGFFLYNYLSTKNNTDRGLAMVISLHPLVGFSACVSIIAALEDSGQGVTVHTVDSMEQGGIGMTYNDAMGMMVL